VGLYAVDNYGKTVGKAAFGTGEYEVIKVYAQRYTWIFEYPNGAKTFNELVIEMGNLLERRRHLALWTATAIAASAATLYATDLTTVNLPFRKAPLEALAMVALLWGISALPFYAVNDPLYRATGDYKFRLAWVSYAAGAALFVAHVGFIALAYAFLVLALAFLNLK